MGKSWVMANLHQTWHFEVAGVMVQETKFPALQQAKTAYPIPDHAWFKATDVSGTNDQST
jgi:hypothetical protein